jgi:hypothetical protein
MLVYSLGGILRQYPRDSKICRKFQIPADNKERTEPLSTGMRANGGKGGAMPAFVKGEA